MQFLRFFTFIFIFIFSQTLLYSQYEDCNSAYNVPNKSTINVASVNSSGQVMDPVIEDITQCFQGDENKSYWLKFKALSSGTFEFKLTPNGLMADYDFIMYDACPCDTNRNIIACKWVGSIVTNFKPTGIATDPLASFGVLPIDALEFTNTINLVAGKSYFLLLNNISASLDPFNNVGFSLEFGGTANIGLVDDNDFGIQNLTYTGPDRVCMNQKNVGYNGNASSTLGYPIKYYWKANNGIIINTDSLKNVSADFGLSGGDICLKASDGCYAPKSICKKIDITDIPDISVIDSTPCHNQFFDLTQLKITDSRNTFGNINYFDKRDSSITNTDSIQKIITKSGKYFVRKTINLACFDTASVDVIVQNLELKRDTFNICSDETRLDTLPMIELNGNSGLIFTYYPDSLSAAQKKNQILNPLVKTTGTYWIRGDSKEGCYLISPVVIKFLPYPNLAASTNFILCDSCILLDTFAFNGVMKPYSIRIFPSVAFAELDLGRITNLLSCKSESFGVKVIAANGCYDITQLDITKIEPSSCILSGIDSICKNIDKEVQLNFNFSGTSPFTAIYSDGSKLDSVVSITGNLIKKITVNKATNFNLIALKDGNINLCNNGKVSGNFDVKEIAQPKVKNTSIICDSTRKSYKVSIEIEGGNGNYLVNGTNIIGNNFLSNSFLNDSVYNFLIQDINKCIPDTVKGVATCACTNSAGFIDEKDTMILCKTDVAFATAINYVLDPEDKIEFILHDSPTNKIGNIFSKGIDPIFSYNPNIITNKVYYISTIVGDSLTDGTVNQKDICLSVAPGRPVIFLTPDTISLGIDTNYCLGTLINLKFKTNKIQNVDVEYTINGTSNSLSNFDLSKGIPLTINGLKTIDIISAVDLNLCPLEIGNIEQNLDVIKKLSTNSLTITCDSLNENYSVNFIVDADAKSIVQVTGLNGNLVGNNFTSNLIKSGLSYTFIVKDQFLCDTIKLTGAKTCDCNKQAGRIDTTSKNICYGDSLLMNILKNNEVDKNDTTIIAFFNDANLTDLVGVTSKLTLNQNTIGGLVANKPYYISLVTGNKLAIYPFVDLSFCHVKTLPQQIIFLDKPTLSLVNTIDTICPNDTIKLIGNYSGSLPSQFLIDNQNYVINQSNFTIPLVAVNAKSYSIKITDKNNCLTDFNNIYKTDLRGKTTIGTFSVDTFQTCLLDTIKMGIVGQTKYKDDSIFYKIEDLNNNLITIQTQPRFVLLSNMNKNTFYKVTMVAYPVKNGIVNPKSNCVEQSKSAFIRFNDLPLATISTLNPICEGDSLPILLNISNDINKFNISLSFDNQVYKFNNLSTGSVFKVKPNLLSKIKLVDIVPINSSIICKPQIDSTELVISFLNAPTLFSSKIICAPNKQTFQLQVVVKSDKIATLVAKGASGNWSNNTFLSDAIASGTNYSVTITDANGCKELIVSGFGDCSCPSNAKPSISILQPVSCFNKTDGILSVKNINGTPPFIYQWSNNISGDINKNIKGGFYNGNNDG